MRSRVTGRSINHQLAMRCHYRHNSALSIFVNGAFSFVNGAFFVFVNGAFTILFPIYIKLKVHTLLGFENFMTFHDLSHDLSEISMTYDKQQFSKYCQNNLLF